jgi:Tol biopolymer transport system component
MARPPYHVIEIGRCEMKKKMILVVAALGLLIALSPAEPRTQQSQTAEVLLGAALHQEEVEGNIEAAIETYQKLLAQYPDNRMLAAEAQFRIGMCYERLGRAEAQKAYEAVLAKYADQPEFAAKARERLAALSVSEAASGPQTMTARMIENPPGDTPMCTMSPDGRYLAFRDWRTGDLAVKDLQTGKDRRLTDEGTEGKDDVSISQGAGYATWSPDGKRVAYLWNIYDMVIRSQELRIVEVDGGKPRSLARSDGSQWGRFVWAPDAKSFVMTISPEQGPSKMVLISVADGSVKTLVELKREIWPTTKIFSPDSRFIAYDRLPDETSPERDIVLLSLETGQDIPLIQHPADDYLLGWSRDGRWLVFASDRTGALGLWVAEMSGTKIKGEPKMIKPGIDRILPVGMTRDGALYYGVVRATEDVYTVDLDPATGKVSGPPRKAIEQYEGGNFTPSYSPDGKVLAYVSRRGNSPYPTNVGNALCLRSLDSGQERVFYKEVWKEGLRNIGITGLSRDGGSIMFSGSDGISRRGVFLLDLHIGKINAIVRFGPDERSTGGTFGPGGTCIFDRVNIKEGFTQVVLRDIKTGEERELFRIPRLERIGYAVSPDGRWLSLALSGEKERALKVMPISGGEAREIWNSGKAKQGMPGFSHTWTPDGLSILFAASDPEDLPIWELWRVPVEGGIPPEKMGLRKRWGIWDLTVRPDGRRLAFASRGGPSDESELWVLENFLPAAGTSPDGAPRTRPPGH